MEHLFYGSYYCVVHFAEASSFSEETAVAQFRKREGNFFFNCLRLLEEILAKILQNSDIHF